MKRTLEKIAPVRLTANLISTASRKSIAAKDEDLMDQI